LISPHIVSILSQQAVDYPSDVSQAFEHDVSRKILFLLAAHAMAVGCATRHSPGTAVNQARLLGPNRIL
jgi:hypothetical protein